MKRYVLVLSLAWAPLVAAQSKVAVFLHPTVDSSDHIGQQVVFELKEAIRSSQSFRLVEEATRWPYMKVFIVTLKTSPANGTAISVAFAYDDRGIPLSGAF